MEEGEREVNVERYSPGGGEEVILVEGAAGRLKSKRGREAEREREPASSRRRAKESTAFQRERERGSVGFESAP